MYTLRPATVDDLEFLYDLHKVTMREYVHATWGWDEAFQRARFAEIYLEQPLSIVIVDGRDNGALSVESRADDEFLRSLEIHARVQRRGLGGAIVRDVVARAQARRVPTVLRVLKANVGARRLYQRLGFAIVGESETHYDMRCE